MSASRTPHERAERAVVLQLLRDDHPPAWSRVELERAVFDREPLTLSDALAHLESGGVVAVVGERVQASSCARHLDTLDLLGV
jgi:hypothetical protein